MDAIKISVAQITSWNDVVNAARFTAGMKPIDKEPSREFKRSMIAAEHSPLRLLEFDIKLYGIPYWVAMHLVRHHIGVQPFISTQRDDRTNKPGTRAEAPQNAPVNMWMRINAQALINISRVRLCMKSSKETREIWAEIVKKIIIMNPEFEPFLVKQCEYRHGCPEIKGCGLMKAL